MLKPEHRYGVLAVEDWSATLQYFQNLAQHIEQSLVVSTQEISDTGIDSCDFSTLKNHLGQSYDAVLLDLSHGLNLSALAILLGTVKGGGLFVLHLGPDWLERSDKELARFLPWPLDAAKHPSHYKHLFYKTLEESGAFHTTWPDSLRPYSPIQQGLNAEQQQLVETLLRHDHASHIVLAPRGRGKSYALAELIYIAQQQGLRVACSASSPANLATLATHFQALSGQPAPYFAPDALLQCAEDFDIIVVDEAARVPLPLLNQLAQRSKCVIFSSTDHGYEGSGRGFGLTFIKQLQAQQRQVYLHTLQQPIRWGENDPLEQWLDQLLFSPYQAKTKSADCPISISGKEWLLYPQLLNQAFSLLVSAHYQTTPENKRWLVDDPSVTCFCLYDKNCLVGVALVTEEGPLPDGLAQQVMHGERRPRGHLLPQSLLAHEGIANAGDFKYWRISRIAIAPEQQNQGLGSILLEQVEQHARQQRVDFLATSFAATTAVTHFWQKNGYQAVRLGSAKDQASGHYSLMMLKALTPSLTPTLRAWGARFAKHWLQTLPMSLQELEVPLIITISHACYMGENPHISDLDKHDVSDLTYFSNHNRPFSSIRSSLMSLAMFKLARQELSAQRQEDVLLLGSALNLITEKQAHSLGYSGKKALYQALKVTVDQHLSSLR